MIGLNRLGLPARPVLSARIRSEPFLYATTATPGETVTIHRITPTGGSITISWGDGEATTVAAGVITAQAHVYAAAGTFEIRVTPLILVTALDIHDPALSGFRSAQLAGNAMRYFVCNSLGATVQNVINSADMIGWYPFHWWLYSVPSGSYIINSSDFSTWKPSQFFLFSMPSGAYTINTADFSLWNILYLYISNMPVGTYIMNLSNFSSSNPQSFSINNMPSASTTWAINSTDLSGFRAMTTFDMGNNVFNQSQVDAILWGLYQASVSPRTATGGTIDVGGTNAAPSGTYQAAAACPVSAATPGKEVAHELANDTCAAGFNKWTTVTFTA